WALLFEGDQAARARRDEREWRGLFDELDRLLEYTSVTLAEQWVVAAEVVQRELHENKLLVESMYHDAEATDRTTLQVSNLNQIAQGLSSSMEQSQQLEIVGDKLKAALEIADLTIWLFDAGSQALVMARSWG